MAEAVLEKEVCDGCGADIREGTLFCYNCGARVVGDQPENAETVTIDDPETRTDGEGDEPLTFNNGNSPDTSNKLAAAATERKRSRVAHRKTAEYVWEPTTGEGSRVALLVSILIAIFALVVVLLMLDW